MTKKTLRRKAIRLQNTDAGAGRKIRPLSEALESVQRKEESNESK